MIVFEEKGDGLREGLKIFFNIRETPRRGREEAELINGNEELLLKSGDQAYFFWG
jgi:hypothetical protein